MTDPETQPDSHQPEAGANNHTDGDNNQDEPSVKKEVIATKVSGTVKWFNVKSGYGFINRNDTQEDVFVHQTAIVKNNPKKAVRSVGDGEVVEFDVVIGEKGNEASNVSGLEGAPVKGSPYAADRRRGTGRFRRSRGRGGKVGDIGDADHEGDVDKDEDEDSGGRGRGRGRGGRGYQHRARYVNRRPRSDGEEGEGEKAGSGEDLGGNESDEGMGGRGRGRGRGGYRGRGRGGSFRGRGAFRARGGGGYRGRGGFRGGRGMGEGGGRGMGEGSGRGMGEGGGRRMGGGRGRGRGGQGMGDEAGESSA